MDTLLLKIFLKLLFFTQQNRVILITLKGFDDQERNLTFVKTDFQVLKLKFHACNFKQALFPLRKLYIA